MSGGISQLPFKDAFTNASTIAISVSGRDYQINGADFIDYVRAALGSPDYTVQNSAPAATGFSIQVNDSDENTWLCISPLGSYAAGTVVLPSVANCVDGQEVIVTCSLAVTTLTVDGNGAVDVIGEPTTLAAGGFFRLRYQSTPKIWYRVG